MQYINLGFVILYFLSLTLIALTWGVVESNHNLPPQYYYQFHIIYAFIYLLHLLQFILVILKEASLIRDRSFFMGWGRGTADGIW